MAEKKTQSVFDRFSAIGAIQADAQRTGKGKRGRGKMGLDFEAFEQSFDISKKINDALKAKADKNKNETLKKLNIEGGVSQPKMDAAMDNVISNYFSSLRERFKSPANVISQGEDAQGYDAAVGMENLLNNNAVQVNKDLELLRSIQLAGKEGVENETEYAKYTNQFQRDNLYNLTNSDYGSLQPEVTEDSEGNARLTVLNSEGKRVTVDNLDLPKVYDSTLEDTFDTLVGDVKILKRDRKVKGDWKTSVERDRIIKNINKVAKNSEAVSQYMYENDELIETIIANNENITKEDFIKNYTLKEREDLKEFYLLNGTIDKDDFIEYATMTIDNTYEGQELIEDEEVEKSNQQGDAELEEDDDSNMNNYNAELEKTEEETEEETKEVARPIGNALIDNPRINKKGVLKAIRSGDLTDEILIKYLSEIPGINIENNEIKGLSTIKPSAFNNAMRKIQEETEIDLDY